MGKFLRFNPTVIIGSINLKLGKGSIIIKLGEMPEKSMKRAKVGPSKLHWEKSFLTIQGKWTLK